MSMVLKAAAVCCLALLAAFADQANAQGNSGKNAGKGAGKSVFSTPGKGPKAIPPGQIKRYTRGAKLPSDLVWDEVLDLNKWKLPKPGRGNRYIRVDNQILEVNEDITTVVEAVGIVDDLLR